MNDDLIPERVATAQLRADRNGFAASSERSVGELLAVLAAAVRPGGRVLEIGTGSGTGLAWIVEGLAGRTDVEVHSVESDPDRYALAATGDWPPFVRLHAGDVLDVFDELGRFELIFADAPGGKWEGLDRTVAALSPGGLLLVDDMAPAEWAGPEHREHTLSVRDTLVGHPGLRSVEIHWSSGLILCARRPY